VLPRAPTLSPKQKTKQSLRLSTNSESRRTSYRRRFRGLFHKQSCEPAHVNVAAIAETFANCADTAPESSAQGCAECVGDDVRHTGIARGKE